jgi:predicted DNA-binding WGR domain protein
MAKQCYEFVAGTSAKFWKVKTGGESVTFEWGRIGTSGQSMIKDFPTSTDATKAAFKKINEKAREGYKQVPC